MGEDVNSPWENEVEHIENMGDADFERRNAYLSLHESNGKAPAIADKLAEIWDISQAKAADRAVRLFLAHLLDTHGDLFPNARENHDVAILIPPPGKVADFEPIDIQYQPHGSRLNISVPPTVRDLVELVEDTNEIAIESKADFLRTALYWISGEFEWETQIEETQEEDIEGRDEQETQEESEDKIPQSYLRTLYISEARQELTDFFVDLEWTEESRALTKQDIVDQTGVQRKSVIKHIDILVELGIVNEIEEGRWVRYEPAVENAPYQSVLETNQILANHHHA